MGKKQHFLTIDTETTLNGKVADFAATITDRKGKILNQCAVLVAGTYNNREHDPLFYDTSTGASLWSKERLTERYQAYDCMIASGARMMASPASINNWLAKAAIAYDPILTAYNLAFDTDKCAKTGIDLTFFNRRFCLWHAACDIYAKTKKYRQFILDYHYFNTPTKKRNMTYQTNAEVMARFVLGRPDLEDEPHTALEDVLYYEIPILNALLKKKSAKQLLEISAGYNWRDYQVKLNFSV